MKEEVEAAAAWWVERLNKKSLTSHQVNVFCNSLQDHLYSRNQGHWFIEDPLRGSAFRSILFDVQLDSVLQKAAYAAGIQQIEDRLPRGVIMFVNPGCVKFTYTATAEDGGYSEIFSKSGIEGGYSLPSHQPTVFQICTGSGGSSSEKASRLPAFSPPGSGHGFPAVLPAQVKA